MGLYFKIDSKQKFLSGEYSLLNVANYVNLNYKHRQINPKKNMVKSSIFEYLEEENGKYICSENEVDNIY